MRPLQQNVVSRTCKASRKLEASQFSVTTEKNGQTQRYLYLLLNACAIQCAQALERSPESAVPPAHARATRHDILHQSCEGRDTTLSKSGTNSRMAAPGEGGMFLGGSEVDEHLLRDDHFPVEQQPDPETS